MNMLGEDGRLNRGYVGIPTFLRSNYCADIDALDARYAVFGVPYDEGSPFLPGSRFGPRAIREHSLRFSPDGIFDPATETSFLTEVIRQGKLVDIGDIDIVPSSPSRTFAGLTDTVKKLRRRGAIPVMLGGDHAVSFPAVRAFEEDIYVIQLDSHIDYGKYDDEFRYGNGQGFRQINELRNVKGLTQIGIRSYRTNPADFHKAKADGSRIVTMPELRERGPTAAVSQIPEGASVYLSIDIDAYDGPMVPGCVSAEPDGPSFAEMRSILEVITDSFHIVGCDLVEVNPPLDVKTGATSYLAALTIALLLGLIDKKDAHGAQPFAAP
ncbi:arginase family protein [Neorhizobium sp. NCHU2750]|uniref:arginase family protein n=1 Tax=Neorhizobium sp. NCHU2750 TaxID=1825976 RepID=UPI000E71BE11|nr:agmatinase [Neorhizobium sp. NCHU2750]